MSAHALLHSSGVSQVDRQSMLARGREILQTETAALQSLVASLDDSFVEAAEKLIGCRGRVIVTGIGKAGIVGQKFSASLSSTGTASHFLHPAEAVHGDLGCVRSGDVVVLMSYSGETAEILRLLPLFSRSPVAASTQGYRLDTPEAISNVTTIAITRDQHSSLGRDVDHVLPIGSHHEACGLGLAPTCSTTLMLAISDALTLVASEAKGFTRQQFAEFHPGGSLGRKLTKVTEVMRPIKECRVASEQLSVREVFVRISRPGRRTGAIMLIDAKGQLSGLFTDSDLARLLESQRDEQLDQPVCNVMSRSHFTVDEDARLDEIFHTLKEHKISELPVINSAREPVGLVDITDIVELATERINSLEPPVSALPQDAAGVPRILSLIKYQKESR